MKERKKKCCPETGQHFVSTRYNQRLENWGARRAAFRPYYFFSQTRKPLCIKGFRHRSRNLTPILTHYKLSQTWLGWLTERCVHNSRKLFGFIILDLCVNVHRNFAVLVAREVLNRFGIDRGIYQIGDICVAKLMRGNLEVQTIHHIAVVSGLFSDTCFPPSGRMMLILLLNYL